MFLSSLRRYIKHLRHCFIGYPNTLTFVKTALLHNVFSTLFTMFGYLIDTLYLVFDILLLVLNLISSWPLWEKFHIYVHPCIILYLPRYTTNGQMSAAYTHGQIVDNELTNQSKCFPLVISYSINIFILLWLLGNVTQ